MGLAGASPSPSRHPSLLQLMLLVGGWVLFIIFFHTYALAWLDLLDSPEQQGFESAF